MGGASVIGSGHRTTSTITASVKKSDTVMRSACARNNNEKIKNFKFRPTKKNNDGCD